MCVSAAQDRAGHRRISYKNIAFFNSKLLISDIHRVAVFLNPFMKHLPIFAKNEHNKIVSLVEERLRTVEDLGISKETNDGLVT